MSKIFDFHDCDRVAYCELLKVLASKVDGLRFPLSTPSNRHLDSCTQSNADMMPL